MNRRITDGQWFRRGDGWFCGPDEGSLSGDEVVKVDVDIRTEAELKPDAFVPRNLKTDVS